MKKTDKSRQSAKQKIFEKVFGAAKVPELVMTDKPLPWPYGAANARDQSAELAAQIVRLSIRGLEMTNNPELLRILASIQGYGNLQLRHLEGQGARTRPIDLEVTG